MKLSTESIKFRITMKYPQILGTTVRLIRQYKDFQQQNVRIFLSNAGEIKVTSDKNDDLVLDIYFDEWKDQKENDTSTKNFSDYYFAVSENLIIDRFSNHFFVAIVPKDYWEEEGYLYDQPLDIEEELAKYKIESPNETSDFQAFSQTNRDELVNLLLMLGLEYNNDISRFLNTEGYQMFIKP